MLYLNTDNFTQWSHARGDIYAVGGRQVAAGTATTSDERAFCSRCALSRCALSPIYRCAACSWRSMCTYWRGFARGSPRTARFLSVLSEKYGILTKNTVTYRSKNFSRRRHAQIKSCINWLYRNDLECHHFEFHDTWKSNFLFDKTAKNLLYRLSGSRVPRIVPSGRISRWNPVLQ